MSYIKLYKVVSRDIIGRWVKIVLLFVGIDIKKFKFYSIRVVVVLVVSNVLVFLDEIFKIVGWLLEFIFGKFYNKFVLREL